MSFEVLPARSALPSLILIALATTLAGQAVQTHGQAVGDPGADRATVWTRVSEDALASVRYSSDPLFNGFLETPPIAVTSATDHTVRVTLTGLAPSTTWFYRFRIAPAGGGGGATLGPLGRFRTAPTALASEDVTLAFAADIADPTMNGLFGSIAAMQPDLLLLLGDFPYADSSPAATTLESYRAKHRAVRDDIPLQALFSTTAIAPVWDDHEISNDWDAATDPARVLLGRSVWKEWMPLDLPTDPIFRSLRFGRGVEVFLLDTRTNRGVNGAPDLVGKPLLGPIQLAWLQSGLSSSTAVFKVIASSIPLRYGTTNKDHWQGYMRERQALLGWITSQRIPNVVFVSGDQHWSAIHHHREGIQEFQACPIAAGIRSPPSEPRPEVQGIYPVHSFGSLEVRTSVTPEELIFRVHAASGVIVSRTLTASTPGSIEVTSDDPEASFVLDGPHRFQNQGMETTLPYAPPGSYSVALRTSNQFVSLPNDPLDLRPGGFASVAARFSTGEDPLHPTLFRADFNTPDLTAWSATDEGTVDAPSAWFQDDFELVQSSNIFGGSTAASSVDKPGTWIAAGDPTWTDVTLTFRVRTHDDDAVGGMIRVGADGSGYRFSIDEQRNYRRLTRTLAGVTTLLAEVPGGYTVDHWHTVTLRAIGPQISVELDGQPLLSATDSALPQGRIALYSWGSQVVWFDDVLVRQGNAPTASASELFAADFSATNLAPWTIVDQGTISAPSTWSVLGGELHQTSNIHGGSLLGTVPDKPGTFLMAGDPAWTDTLLRVRLRNDDDDGIGVMFRTTDGDNTYRFSMDSERSFRRICRVQQGVTIILDEDAVAYTPAVWYDVEIRCGGDALEVWIDGLPILSATDATLPSGRMALYSWGSTGARFDDLIVTQLGAQPLVLTASGDDSGFRIGMHAPGWQNHSYVLALSLGTTPGFSLSVYDPLDSRVLPLNVDPVFSWSLQPNPLLLGFTGSLDSSGRALAEVVLPPGTSVSGLTLFASGVILDSSPGSIFGAVWPALPLRFP